MRTFTALLLFVFTSLHSVNASVKSQGLGIAPNTLPSPQVDLLRCTNSRIEKVDLAGRIPQQIYIQNKKIKFLAAPYASAEVSIQNVGLYSIVRNDATNAYQFLNFTGTHPSVLTSRANGSALYGELEFLEELRALYFLRIETAFGCYEGFIMAVPFFENGVFTGNTANAPTPIAISNDPTAKAEGGGNGCSLRADSLSVDFKVLVILLLFGLASLMALRKNFKGG